MNRKALILAVMALGLAASACSKTEPDVADTFDTKAHDWLEEIEGDKALAWAKGQNERSLAVLQADHRYQGFFDEALKLATAKDRIPMGAIRNGYVYNFWQDETHVQGIYRRVKLADYAKEAPPWETVLDVDALAKAEGKKWVYQGVSCLPPAKDLCLVTLSNGGKDAAVRREFSLSQKAFVEGGFDIPEAKADVIWQDKDTLLIATDWGPGSLTSSGYPFITKMLKRGQTLADAVEVARGEATDVSAGPFSLRDETGKEWFGTSRGVTFFERTYSVFPKPGAAAIPLPIPLKAGVQELYGDRLFVTLEQDWTPEGQETFKTGDLVAFKWSEFIATGKLPKVELVLRPTERQSIEGLSATKNELLLSLSDNVLPKVFTLTPDHGGWKPTEIPLPANGTASIAFATNDEDVAFLTYESYLVPDSLYSFDSRTRELKELRTLAPRFDASPYVAEQFESTSSDGTKIPYFVVHRKDIKLDGSNPTLLYAYGGFQVSYPPGYSGTIGKLWLDQGGVYALANIRGGGEFGPAWHDAGLKTKRQIVYDDFISVAEDLIARKITSKEKLGAMGGSNGGLLMGVMFIQRPDLFKAIVCQVPLLDMIGYTHLGAGASWIAEYGDPAVPEELAWLKKLSPYHNVKANVSYPEIYLETSTKDDRVHPAHARKLGKRLEDLGKPFLYYENMDGGHSAAANQQESARRSALEFTYLARKLMPEKVMDGK